MNLTNKELFEKTKALVKEEKRLGFEVIKHLQEISKRKLYLEKGYPSLFEMCLKEFGYSAPAAQRRIEAMRLMTDLPEVEESLKSGSLSLSAAAQVQVFFRQEEKRASLKAKDNLRDEKQALPQSQELLFAATISLEEAVPEGSSSEKTSLNLKSEEPHLIESGPLQKGSNKAEKLLLLKSLEGKSSREVEKELLQRNPELKLSSDRIRQISPERFEMKIQISKELHEKLEALKALLSHKTGGKGWEAVLTEMAEIALIKLDPAKRPLKKNTERALQNKSLGQRKWRDLAGEKKPSARKSRFIRKSIKAEIWQRDEGSCTYVDPQTQKRCGSKHFLQLDHVQAFSLGGETTVPNLRLLCGAHNRSRNERSYGTALDWDS